LDRRLIWTRWWREKLPAPAGNRTLRTPIVQPVSERYTDWVITVLVSVLTLRTRTEMVFETLLFSPFNHLTRLTGRENFIILSRQESNRSYNMINYFSTLL
jgi:hypothetical protein